MAKVRLQFTTTGLMYWIVRRLWLLSVKIKKKGYIFFYMNKEVKYYQDKKNGVTVAVLTDTAYDARAILDDRIGRPNYYGYDTDFIPDTIRGVTHLNPEDKWDAEYGKQKAERKALSTRKKLINAAIREEVRRMIRDAVQLDKDAAFKEIDKIYAEKKRSTKDGVD